MELPADFVRRLGRVSADDFQQSLDPDALADWWTKQDRDQLRRVLDRVVGDVDARTPSGDQPHLVEHLIEVVVELPATVAGAVLGAVVGDLAGAGIGADRRRDGREARNGLREGDHRQRPEAPTNEA